MRRTVKTEKEKRFYSHLRDRLNGLMQATDMSVYKLSSTSDLSNNTLSNFLEGGTNSISLFSLVSICKSMSIDIADLLDFNKPFKATVTVMREVIIGEEKPDITKFQD